MLKAAKTFLLNILDNLDQRIQKQCDRILPQNLTLRYIVGLTAIGVLTLGGHLVIQFSLIKLSQDENTIRMIENQINDSQSFYRDVIRLQTASSEKDFKGQILNLGSNISSLSRGHHDFLTRVNEEKLMGLGFPKKLHHYKLEMIESWDKLYLVLGQLENISYLDDPEIRINDPAMVNFIKAENRYRDVLGELLGKYNSESSQVIDNFKRLELIFLLLTFLVLIIEGLYVFRPAVHRVHSAIQLRTEFLSRMSHEIRNPMNSILGMTQLLLKNKPNQQQKNYLNILENSSQGLLEMLNNLLDFSSIESGKMKLESIRTDIYSVLEKSIDLLTTKIQEKNVEFILEIFPDVPLKIKSDPVRLQQVLVNLLSNAAKFTEQGYIVVKVTLVSTHVGKKLLFTVTDSGVGIDETKVESIFESFVQENTSVRRKYGGTGLGLAIAKEIINLMGGEIVLETKKGVGSTFAVMIPFVTAGDDRTLGDYIPVKLDSKKYMLIDKHERASQNISMIIKDQGGQINRLKGVVDFSEMLRYIRKTDYDRILIDAATFGTKLEDFLIFLKEQKFNLDKICVLFRYVHSNYLFDLLNNHGIHHFFAKPIKPIEFINYLSGHASQLELAAVKEDDSIFSSTKRYKILIAEDSADNRMLLQVYLEKFPADLFFAENGKRAVDLFRQQKFDIVFMDIQMPEMDGLTATSLIRDIERAERSGPTPILAFSAHKPQEIFHDSDDKLFTDFVLKPVSSQTVKNKLNQYLRFKQIDNGIPKPEIKKIENGGLDVSDLVPAYLERRSQEIIHMSELFEKGDLNALGRIGHQLKGSAKSYGFDELGLLGDQLEKLAHAENAFEIKKVIYKISSLISDYRKANA